ncbi:sperm axonemal maintenance protein CFAP97D1 isoform X2 [Coregonus clupeaformis]|uniref:sperm axonemal maintenance protein CFAP97D1 isoform X2 n=1 Tax=Coregonus clupeaformis TaxID=59861 RepID=UPI001BDF9118|nr:sperm axonemal maintenance protein CFAP97D1 isoform X2 [Coregonus clupeaformis]
MYEKVIEFKWIYLIKLFHDVILSHFPPENDTLFRSKQMVDNKAPRTYLHCHLNMKKIQMEQERLMELERDNRLLVSRIARTMGTKGGLDNWNEYQAKPSVNADLRNRELVKISLENQAILKKINMTKSVYDHRTWLDDFKVSRGYVNRLLKYPEQPILPKQHKILNLV